MMRTDDKIIAGSNKSVDDNLNTRDQRRVGIWFLVITALTMIGLISLGDSHAPSEHASQQAHDMSGASGQVLGTANPPGFDVNRPVGVIEWPGMVGQKPKYLTGKGNTPATNVQQGVSEGVSPNTATDDASKKRAGSGTTPSDSMPTQGSPTATPESSQGAPGSSSSTGTAAGAH